MTAPGPQAAEDQDLGSQLRLDGKVAWVTGASRGLGRAIASGLAAAGARVALMARDPDSLREACDEIRRRGGDALALPGSVSAGDEVESVCRRIAEQWGGVDILVNNAGISPTLRRSVDVPASEWRDIIETNLTGAFHCATAAGRLMLAAGRGSIINVSSVHATAGAPRLLAYAASKAGIEALTRGLALEWAEHGVRVNNLAPGYFTTDMTRLLREHQEHNERLLSRVPLRRYGAPDELVPLAVFLASDASSYVTGSTFVIDGGWTAQ